VPGDVGVVEGYVAEVAIRSVADDDGVDGGVGCFGQIEGNIGC
jgi:hypothetical protein